MELHLSRDSTTCTILCAKFNSGSSDASETTPLYHIYTPSSFSRKTTTISRISPSVANNVSYKFNSDHKSDIRECTQYEEGGVEEIARIQWKMLGSSKIVYDGKPMDVNKFMPSGGFLWSDRTFVGPDGRSYNWHSGSSTSHLALKDGSKHPPEIARLHSRGTPGLSLKTNSHLEIRPEGMHMLDLIVVTWVYIETRRRDHEKEFIFLAASGAANGS